MKILFLIAASVVLSGCSSLSKNLVTFVQNLPTNTVTDASQYTTTPIYTHSESVTGMSKSSDGTVTVTNAKAQATIPEAGITWGLSVSGLTVATKK